MCKCPGAAIFICAMVLSGAGVAEGAGAPPEDALRIEQQRHQRQQQRDKALRQRMAPDIDALHGPPPSARRELPIEERPCFVLQEVRLTGPRSAQLPWLLDASGLDLGTRPCIGALGIEVILARMQQALVARGYITSRVMVAAQNLQGGVLEIVFVPGVLRAVRLSPDSQGETSILTALPSRRGELLQLRDIEQGLENLQRVRTVDADIEIVPAEGLEPGQSDLLIRYRAATPWRLNLTLDNGGTQATGKRQGAATLSWDNPLQRNDLLYLSLGRGLGNADRGSTENRVLHYSLPLHYWLLGVTASSNSYHQHVAGAYEDYVYRGDSSQLDARLSRVIHRSGSSRTTAGITAFHRASSNFIDDTEIDVQRRRSSGYELSLAQLGYWGATLFEGNLAFKRGTGAFAALRAPEEPWGEGTSRMKIYLLDLALSRPFELAGTHFRFSTAWHGQWNATPLTPQDRISIGGRYTVRGFDGENTLLAERGGYWRNELGVALNAGVEAFLALDSGRVGGPSAAYLVGRSLTGAALGLRGAGHGLFCQVFVATPLSKPAQFQTAHRHFSFSLNYGF